MEERAGRILLLSQSRQPWLGLGWRRGVLGSAALGSSSFQLSRLPPVSLSFRPQPFGFSPSRTFLELFPLVAILPLGAPGPASPSRPTG